MGRRRAGRRRHAGQPRGRARPLLLRDARRLQRPDPAVGRSSAIISSCSKCANCTSCAKQVTETQVAAKLAQFRREFDVSPECAEAELVAPHGPPARWTRWSRSTALGSLAYYYEGEEGNPYRDIVTSVIAGNTLLTGHHVPVAGECEIKNVQAMKIMDLFGAGGSFSEFYLADFKDDVVFLGHDGPAHFAIAEGRVGLVPLPVYHGKPGQGLSIQMTREARPGDAAVGGAGSRRQGLSAGGGRRIGARPGAAHRQHEQPLPLLHRRAKRSSTRGRKPARPTTAPLAWATWPISSRNSGPFWGSR